MVDDSSRPAVLDPDETWHLPNEVYLACRPNGSAGPLLEVRDWSGQRVVPAYSTLENFLDGCGPDQPWICVPAAVVADLARGGTGEELFRFNLLLDVALPADLRGTCAGMVTDEPVWDDERSEDWQPVLLASQPFTPGAERANLELHPTRGGHLTVLAYSSQSTLEAGCGPHQHAFPVPAGLVAEARRQSGAHTICLDSPLPEDLRHGPNERNRH